MSQSKQSIFTIRLIAIGFSLFYLPACGTQGGSPSLTQSPPVPTTNSQPDSGGEQSPKENSDEPISAPSETITFSEDAINSVLQDLAPAHGITDELLNASQSDSVETISESDPIVSEVVPDETTVVDESSEDSVDSGPEEDQAVADLAHILIGVKSIDEILELEGTKLAGQLTQKIIQSAIRETKQSLIELYGKKESKSYVDQLEVYKKALQGMISKKAEN